MTQDDDYWRVQAQDVLTQLHEVEIVRDQAKADYAVFRAVARRCFAEDTTDQDMLNLWRLAAAVEHPGAAFITRFNKMKAELEQAQIEIAVLRDNERQVEVFEQRLRRAEADAGWLRGLVQRAIAHLDSYGEVGTPIAAMAEDLEVLLAKTGDAGAALLNELKTLRELRDDVIRWRDGGGDVRDLAYVLETIEKARTE